jgi:hypothetical protein
MTWLKLARKKSGQILGYGLINFQLTTQDLTPYGIDFFAKNLHT